MKGGSKMEKSVQITLIVVVGVLVLAGIGYAVFASVNHSYENTVTGNGQAIIKATPDLVAVYFNVQTDGDTSKEATDANSEIIDDLIVNVLKLGFERKDITTSNFNVRPNYDWVNGNRVENGYTALHTVKVEMSTDDASKIGEVIDAGVDAGAGVSYINFELTQEKQNEYKAQAIKLAAQDARIKAESIADGLEQSLGDLVSVSDSNFNYAPWGVYEARATGVAEDAALAKEATTNIQPGEQEIYASVRAIFELK